MNPYIEATYGPLVDAATCAYCADGIPLVSLSKTRKHMISRENGGDFRDCTSKRAEVLPIIERAVLAEREACATVIDDCNRTGPYNAIIGAELIRARSGQAGGDE